MASKLTKFFNQFLSPLKTEENKEPITLEKQLQLATCALLIEMSKSDNNVSQEETDVILEALTGAYKISKEELNALKNAAEENVNNSTSLRPFTMLINEHYSSQQKEEIIKLLWRVAHADGVIDKHESHLIRAIADLLYIPREHAMSLRN